MRSGAAYNITMQSCVGLVQGDSVRAVELDMIRQTGRREIENAAQCRRSAENVAVEGDQVWPNINPIDGVETDKKAMFVRLVHERGAWGCRSICGRKVNLAVISTIYDKRPACDASCRARRQISDRRGLEVRDLVVLQRDVVRVQAASTLQRGA